ncbi:MAG: amino acid adenylation domain-containing protein [Dehalococcoidia bacterium]
MNRLLQDWLTSSAERFPESCAVHAGPRSSTFADLEQESNRLAHALKDAGCVRGDRVAFALPKGTSAYMTMLGALKAGASYVPLDVQGPALRLSRVLSATEPRCLVATPGSFDMCREAARLAGNDEVRFAVLDGRLDDREVVFSSHDLPAFSGHRPSNPTGPDEPAHLLFTSGSTGVPKGVVVTHRMVTAFVEWAVEYFDMGHQDRLSAHSPLTFDLSTFDFYAAMAAGAELHPVPPKHNLLAPKLVEFMADRGLTQWFSVPSVLTYIESFDALPADGLPRLKRLMWCGEVLPTSTLRYLMERLPHVTFTNLYGPTEAAIASSYYTVPEIPGSPTASIPIGQPCAGESLHVLDEDLRPCAVDEVGDLYIGGVGLSPGYWRDAEKTESVFLDGPFLHLDVDRIYRTGDLASAREDGQIVFHGRADTQIKSRGYRIELGEIEAALAALDFLRESAVVAIQREGFEGSLICCAYVPAPGDDVDVALISRALLGYLPRYMLPARWLEADALPRTSNGKVDRPALKDEFLGRENLLADFDRERQL